MMFFVFSQQHQHLLLFHFYFKLSFLKSYLQLRWHRICLYYVSFVRYLLWILSVSIVSWLTEKSYTYQFNSPSLTDCKISENISQKQWIWSYFRTIWFKLIYFYTTSIQKTVICILFILLVSTNKIFPVPNKTT